MRLNNDEVAQVKAAGAAVTAAGELILPWCAAVAHELGYDTSKHAALLKDTFCFTATRNLSLGFDDTDVLHFDYDELLEEPAVVAKRRYDAEAKERELAEAKKAAMTLEQKRALYMALKSEFEDDPQRRTKAQVLAARQTLTGCCERYCDQMACDCLAQAAD